MLMGQSLEEFLSSLVSYGDLTRRQKRTIIKLSDDSPSVSGGLFGVATPDEAAIEAVESIDSLTLNRGEQFSPQAKSTLRSYLLDQISSYSLEEEIGEVIASTLSLGGLFPNLPISNIMAAFENNVANGVTTPQPMALNGPVSSDYSGQGNMNLLGKWNELNTVVGSVYYNGIWGYAVGEFVSCAVSGEGMSSGEYCSHVGQ